MQQWVDAPTPTKHVNTANTATFLFRRSPFYLLNRYPRRVFGHETPAHRLIGAVRAQTRSLEGLQSRAAALQVVVTPAGRDLPVLHDEQHILRSQRTLLPPAGAPTSFQTML